MRFGRQFVILTGICLLGSACEKELKVNLRDKEKLMVVEGVIENDQQPYVMLTQSVGFFSTIDFSKITFIEGAEVKVADLTTAQEIILKEYTLDTLIGNRTWSFRVYAPDLQDPQAMNFKGIVNHTYRLSIQVQGRQWVSFTRIPDGHGLDSVWTEPVPGRESTHALLRAIYTDPDTFGNAVRVQTLLRKRMKDDTPEIFYAGFTEVYDDEIFNGVKLPLTLDLGFDKNKVYSGEELETLGFMNRGDTVTIKWSAIDRQVFNFWQTMGFSQGSIGNPFAAPTKIQSNVPGALGVWAGYYARYYTIVDTL